MTTILQYNLIDNKIAIETLKSLNTPSQFENIQNIIIHKIA